MNKIKKYTRIINSIRNTHSLIKNIHPVLYKLYPISIVEDNSFYVFDYDLENERYSYILEHSSLIPLPDKVRAAFNIYRCFISIMVYY
ncbi:hypothetical protein RJG79_07995 [Mycoplasmatota bacterium WC44]